MRSRTRFLALLLLGLLLAGTVVVPRVVRFVRIFGPHSGPALTQEEIEAAYNRKRGNDDDDVLPQRIPKIIHQIFHNWRDLGNEIIPSDWDAVRETCRFHNPDFEHRLWTESASLAFIGEHYPWFLDTYRGYGFPVQRVDALRYFLMLKIGGFYIDLDNGCSRSLTPLLTLPAFVTDGGKGALSNNIIGSRPNHPFWREVASSLRPWSYHYYLPYFTISYASGQWFETAIWELYFSRMRADVSEENKVYRVMMGMDEGSARWVFFTQGRGGTWDNWDNRVFSFVGNELVPWVGGHVVFLSVVVGVVVVGGVVWLRRRRRGGYPVVVKEVV